MFPDESKRYEYKCLLPKEEVEEFFAKRLDFTSTQVGRELTYFRNSNSGIKPSFLVLYEREACEEKDNPFRLTLDYSPRYRVDDFNLSARRTFIKRRRSHSRSKDTRMTSLIASRISLSRSFL